MFQIKYFHVKTQCLLTWLTLKNYSLCALVGRGLRAQAEYTCPRPARGAPAESPYLRARAPALLRGFPLCQDDQICFVQKYGVWKLVKILFIIWIFNSLNVPKNFVLLFFKFYNPNFSKFTKIVGLNLRGFYIICSSGHIISVPRYRLWREFVKWRFFKRHLNQSKVFWNKHTSIKQLKLKLIYCIYSALCV